MTFENHKVRWCGLCEVAIIQCEFCGNSSCNGSGCEKCCGDKHIKDSYKDSLFGRFGRVARKILKCDLPIEDQDIGWERKLNVLLRYK